MNSKLTELAIVPPIPDLQELIRVLDDIFQSDCVNVEYVEEVLRSYKSNPRDWSIYAKFDPHKYTRNLVYDGIDGKYNLMVLAWAEGQGSGIHDHSNSHCFMKVLSGTLTEVKYAWPEDPSTETEMKVISETGLYTDQVTYINDSIGLHRVENPSHTETAVSLHLYSPPYSKCRVFDQRTGHVSTSVVTFWSVYGKRTPFATLDKRTVQNDDNKDNPAMENETTVM